MRRQKIDASYIQALSRLEPVDYSSTPALADVYKRLDAGRNAFAEIFDLNVNAVSEISALDLEIKFYTEQLEKITQSVVTATKDIHKAASESTDISGVVADRHENLTTTIITVSEESSNVYQKIDSSQQSLTEIRKLSDNTISISQKMQEDMNQLSDIIHNMNDVISAIQNISSQTNLLSLNASIEAARSGEAGRGFAVVADEIRKLADETKTLTNNMSQFVSSVESAAEESVTSVNSAIASLEEVNQKIKDVWTLNEENQSHIGEITNSISNLAAISEEISSNMNEIQASSCNIENSCSVLKNDTEGLNQIAEACFAAIKPIGSVEKRMDDVLAHMGRMSSDAFFALSQKELTAYFDAAIDAHRKWVEKLNQIVTCRSIVPFQVDDTKCRFGHFLYSIQPPVPEMKVVWDKIGAEHKKLHQLGGKVIKAMFDDDYTSAKTTYQEVLRVSEQLIGELERIKLKIPKSSNI